MIPNSKKRIKGSTGGIANGIKVSYKLNEMNDYQVYHDY